MKNLLTLLIVSLSLVLSSCSGCSKSGRRNVNNDGKQSNKLNNSDKEGKNVVKMVKVNSIYEIPVEIDEVPMHFIFDTGAGIISISDVEAVFLFKQGKLTDDDIIGKENFSDATGSISEGTIINLKTVKIGNKILENIQASVVHNLDAPLLMGQSALEKFGRISIDYKRGELTFE